jgi:excinuclease ABC subunit C
LKDDKSFPYLKLTVQEKYPGVYFTRKVVPDGARYFGPFAPPNEARRTIHLVNKHFRIRGCDEAVPGRRKRPCLEYELKLCSAPCVANISEEAYRESVENALLFLEGKTEKLAAAMKRKMKDAADKQDFEEAAHWRDIIRTLEEIKAKPKFISAGLENLDIFGFARGGSHIGIFIFFMRRGKVRESKEVFFEEREDRSDRQILFRFLVNFYRARGEKPDKILAPFIDLSQREKLAQLFAGQGQKKVEVLTPFKGKSKALVELAKRNAEILLQKKKDKSSPLRQAMTALGLRSLPQTIEGYDISNTGGSESVGSVVVFENGLPNKNEYRKYTIKTIEGPNDVASLKEVIRRRYKKILEEKSNLPDLILVDGGKGQLQAALNALKDVRVMRVPVISLAKKQEVLFSPAHKEGIRLDRTSPALKLFQSIRDEAHRFAISFHRRRREKRSFESSLDGIPGLGKKRKTALLTRYGSIEEIQNAPLDELAKIIGKKAATEVVVNGF